MQTILDIVLVVVSVLLITAILLQQKGSGLSGVFGGGSASYLTRRGAEKFLTFATVGLVAVFIVVSVALLIIK